MIPDQEHMCDLVKTNTTDNVKIFCSDIHKLHIFRMKYFLKELLTALNENVTAWMPIIKESTNYALQLIHLKKSLQTTINEIALAAFWHVLQSRGINRFSLLRLISVSRNVLRKRILYKRLIKILSYIRSIELNYSPHKEIVSIILTTIPRIVSDERFLHISAKNQKNNIPEYAEKLKKIAIKIVNNLDPLLLSGKSRKVIAALSIYIADKIISKKEKIKPRISAKTLEKHLDVSQFTILRRYKDLLQKISSEVLF